MSRRGVGDVVRVLTRVMSSSLGEAEVFDRIVKAGAELLGALVASLWIADERDRFLTVRSWSNTTSGRDWRPETLPYRSGGIGWVASHRRMLHRADIIADDTFLLPESREWARRHRLPCCLGAPIMLDGELLGVLVLFGEQPFDLDPDEQELLEAFTAQAAAVIANSRIYQEALRDRDFHRTVAGHSTDAIIATDAEARVTYISPRAEAMFECPASAVLGRDIRTLATHLALDPATMDAIERRLRSGEALDHDDLTISRCNGETLEITMAVRPLAGRGGERAGWVVVVRDVSDARAMSRNLQQTERLSVMGLLVAGVAHELSNPLQVVVGHADLLRMSTPDLPQVTAKAEQIHRAASRCSQIVGNFLALARRRPHERQMVGINAVVQEALDLLAYQLRLDGIDVHTDLAPDLPEVWGDAHELHQVIVNLIANARQVMRRGTDVKQLRLATRQSLGGTRVIVEVSDSGPGVPPALRDRIFEPFFTTAPPGEGTGLGLPMCHSIVVAHGGTIELATPGVSGATFVVELPAGSAAPFADTASASAVEETPRQRVLVVDDQPAVGDLVGALLQADGHTAVVERDGARALERLTEMSFDLVIVDVHLERMDGVEFYRRLEQMAPQLAHRVIVMTGDTVAPAALMERGLTTLSKPFRRECLRAAIRRALAA